MSKNLDILRYFLQDESVTRSLFDVALTLSCSSRPQDSTTAAYLLKVLLHQPTIFQTMKDHGTSLHRKSSQNGKEACVQNEACGIENEAFLRKQVPECQMQTFCENSNSEEKSKTLYRTDNLDIADSDAGRHLLLLVILLNSLKDQVVVARDNLIVAAATCPLYPTMQCMRYCLADIHFR